MAITAPVVSGHTGITSDDPNNLTGQLFMKGERENTTLMLVGGLNSIQGQSSVEFTCGQDFSVPDHTAVYDRLEGETAQAHASVKRHSTNDVIMKYFTIDTVSLPEGNLPCRCSNLAYKAQKKPGAMWRLLNCIMESRKAFTPSTSSRGSTLVHKACNLQRFSLNSLL